MFFILCLIAVPTASAQSASESATPTSTPTVSLPGVSITLPSVPVISPPVTSRPTTAPVATPSATPVVTLAPTLKPSLTPLPTILTTPKPTIPENISSAAGGLVAEYATPSASPKPTPTAPPSIIKKIEDIKPPKPEEVVKNIQDKVNTAIHSPVESITRSLASNPYEVKTLSKQNSISLLFVSILLTLVGINLIKPEIITKLKNKLRIKDESFTEPFQPTV